LDETPQTPIQLVINTAIRGREGEGREWKGTTGSGGQRMRTGDKGAEKLPSLFKYLYASVLELT